MSNSFVMIPSEKVDQILKEIENLKSQLDNLKDPSKNGQGKSSDKLLSRHELSEKLNVTLQTIDNWKASGLIPFKRVGNGRGRIFFVLEDVVGAMRDSRRFSKRR